MNDRLSLKIRLLAMALHAIVGIPIGIIAIYGLSFLIVDRKNYLLSLLVIDFLLGLPSIFILPVVAWLLWLATKRIHPFVDRAGRNSINYALNMLLLILFLLFVTIGTCGIVTNGNSGGSTGDTFIAVSLFTFNCIAIAYALNSVAAGIFALRGLQFKNRLIYPFLQDI